MNITKRTLLQLSKETVEYIASVIPPAVSHISPDMSPEIAAVFATAIKSTCFKIIEKASEFMDEGVDIREIDLDWRANYFDKCRTVYDEDMQTLWAKILAGEGNKPGTYSKRSVNFVADLDKRDAELFTDLCGYVCEIKYTYENIEKTEFIPLIFDDYLLPTRDSWVTEPTYHIRSFDLEHLDNIGLVRFAEQKRYSDQDVIESDGDIEVSYYGESICLSKYQQNNIRVADHAIFTPPTGRVRLTQIGEELYPICGSTPVDGFFTHICHRDWLPFIKGLDDDTKARERFPSRCPWCEP